MARVRDQCHRVGQEAKAALDNHESQVEEHGGAHSQVDAIARNGVRVAMCVAVPRGLRMIVVAIMCVVVPVSVCALRSLCSKGFVFLQLFESLHAPQPGE